MPHVLIVEDNPRILAFLRQGLTEEGYVVETADRGVAGIIHLLDKS